MLKERTEKHYKDGKFPVELKVKIKSLAEEAKIIRREEALAKTPEERLKLAVHRRGVVRYEQRHTLLAYAYIRGIPYRVVESNCHEQPNTYKVARMVEKYGEYDGAALQEWFRR